MQRGQAGDQLFLRVTGTLSEPSWKNRIKMHFVFTVCSPLEIHRPGIVPLP